MLDDVVHLRRGRAEQPEVPGGLAEPDLVRNCDGVPAPPSEPDAVPAARAGAAVPGALLPRPARLSGVPVAAVRELRRRLRVRLGVGELLGRDPELPRPLHPLARVRRHRDAARALLGLSAGVLDRLPRRPLEEPAAAVHRRALLRHLPDPDARVGDDPRRPGAGRRLPARHRDPRRRTAGCWRPRPPSSPGSPTTSSRSWRCRCTSRSSRSTSD